MTRYHSFDFIKFFAALAVVVIHVTATISHHNLDNFWTKGWYEPITRFAVPFFFSVSGYLLYIKTKDNPDAITYTWNYMMRIVRYYFIFMAFYIGSAGLFMVADRIFLDKPFKPALYAYFDKWSYIRLFNGDLGNYHLWFLAALFYACVIFMLFIRFKVPPKFVLLICSLIFIVRLVRKFELDQLFVYGGMSEALFYMSIGYFLASVDIKRVNAPILGLIASVVLYYIYVQFDTSIRVLFLAFITFYLMAVCVKYPNMGKGTWIAKVGSRALEIYLLHLFVRDIVYRVFVYSGIKDYYANGWYFFFAITLSFLVPLLLYRLFKPLERLKIMQ